MDKSVQRIAIGVTFFTITILVAVCGYVIAGWSLLEAVYMVVITVFGVGYGEVRPIEGASLKAFTILVIIAGALSVAYIISGIIQVVAAGEIQKALDLRRMVQTIENLSGHIIICGYGRIGQTLAQQLTAEHRAFVVLDSNPDKISRGQALGYLCYLGNAADEVDLEAVGIHRADAIATVLPDDAVNVFVTLTARELNSSLMILARGEAAATEKKLRLAGANHVVLPTSISALRMAHLLINPATEDFLAQIDSGQANGRNNLNQLLAEIDIQIREVPVNPQSELIGKTIGDIEVKGRGTFIIVALRRRYGEILVHPDRQVALHDGDAVLIMGHPDDMPTMIRNQMSRPKLQYRGARVR
ncbi:MAG: NAD-binding protein [Cyanobacteria bacterium P01_A01_bin.105]